MFGVPIGKGDARDAAISIPHSAGAPIRAENYAQAEIVAGRVGAQQTQPRREFD